MGRVPARGGAGGETAALELPHGGAARIRALPKDIPMLDVAMLALGLGFLALCVGYAVACDRL
jgi:hypothetical protein